jgi:hypothetical protein
MLSLVPELLVNIAHIGKVNEDKLAHSRIQLRTLGVKYGKYPRASLAQTMARWSRGRMAGRSNGSRRATLAALQLLPMSALQRIANSSRTLRHVRKVPWRLYGAIGVKAFRYGSSPCSAGLRHLLVPTCFSLGCCAQRRSRVAEGHRGATCP